MDQHSSLGLCSSEQQWRPENPLQHRQVETCWDQVQLYRALSILRPCLVVLCLLCAEPVTRSALCTCCSYSSEHASPSSPTTSSKWKTLVWVKSHRREVGGKGGQCRTGPIANRKWCISDFTDSTKLMFFLHFSAHWHFVLVFIL